MLGRFVQEKFVQEKYDIVSKEVIQEITKSDYVIANLESPVTDCESTSSLAFAGGKNMLNEFKWINCFSLANNHINDFGEDGMDDTIANLEKHSIIHNGLYTQDYCPHIVESVEGGGKIAIVMCTDMLNYEFENNCKYQVLKADSSEVNSVIKRYSDKGYFTILFAHCGSLFSRFPNPEIRELLHSAVDAGAGCIVTAHSHCLGGEYQYKGVPIFWSLGDFLMDGGSYRRRKAGFLTLQIENNQLKKWKITPTITNNELQVVFPIAKEAKKILKGYEKVSRKMSAKQQNYAKFYKVQYKKEMMYHSFSTLQFLYDTKGILGLLRMLKVRYYAVYRMVHRMILGRSGMRYDTDGIDPKHLLNNDDIR